MDVRLFAWAGYVLTDITTTDGDSYSYICTPNLEATKSVEVPNIDASVSKEVPNIRIGTG